MAYPLARPLVMWGEGGLPPTQPPGGLGTWDEGGPLPPQAPGEIGGVT